MIYPGAPDFLDYVDTSRGRYETTLLEAAFEYDQVEEGLGAAEGRAELLGVRRRATEDVFKW